MATAPAAAWRSRPLLLHILLSFALGGLAPVGAQAAAAAEPASLPGGDCPYTAVTRPCQLTASGGNVLVEDDCILGSPGTVGLFTFGKLTIRQGARLLVAREADVGVSIAADGIKVDGELWAGCPGSPAEAFQGNLSIELTGDFKDRGDVARWVDFSWASAGLPSPGKDDQVFPKALLVTSTGRLELHGAPRTSWRRLAAGAAAGTGVISLDSEAEWGAGDELVIGSTSADAGESEVLVVAGVRGREVTLAEPLQYAHAGDFKGYGSPLNAPVGLRTRNIKVRGRMADGTLEQEAQAWQACQWAYSQLPGLDPDSVREKCFGGHTIYFQHSVVHIEHAEFTSMGQGLVMARYPVHWHLAGNASGQYVRSCAFHNNFQRCSTLHGAADVLVADNVCHNTFGHAFYLEDGIETGNTFERNLVISAQPGGSVCTDFRRGNGARTNAQLGPSGFWITNPDNSFIDNHVVGVGTGYWFTFPMASPGGCALAPSTPGCCGAAAGARYGAGGVFGPSGRYFDDPRSGYGPEHWWTNQEQARTPVRLFRGNLVSASHRGIYVDGRVYDSSDKYKSALFPGGRIPCLGDGCPTCSGPLETSFTWAPMLFDRSAALPHRTYEPTANLFESFYAAHIMGDTQLDESRALWASGGVILFTGAVMFNAYVGAAASQDLSGGCYRAVADAPPGFPVVFQDSVFISGPLSSSFFEIYDAGILVSNSRWAMPPGTRDDFYVAKPKAAFGGNGNPVYFRRSGPLGRFPTDLFEEKFAWALGFASETGQLVSETKLASFEALSWTSPYTSGSYVYSADGFGVGRRLPTVVAADANGSSPMWGKQARCVQGENESKAYLYWTPPRFSCGNGFGSYGRWCGDGIPLCRCPGAVDDAREWYKDVLPWRSPANASAARAPSRLSPDCPPAATPRPQTAGAAPEGGLPVVAPDSCTFPAPPPPSAPYVWDAACRIGGLGCYADGIHPECRWCGFGPFAECPMAPSSATSQVGEDLQHGSARTLRRVLLGCTLAVASAAACWALWSHRTAVVAAVRRAVWRVRGLSPPDAVVDSKVASVPGRPGGGGVPSAPPAVAPVPRQPTLWSVASAAGFVGSRVWGGGRAPPAGQTRVYPLV